MKMLQNMKVGTKIILLVVILLGFMGGLSFYSLLNLNNTNTELSAMYTMDLAGVDIAKEANIALISASRALRNGMVFSKDKERFDNYLKGFDEQSAKVTQLLKDVGARSTNPDTQKILRDTQAAAAEGLAAERSIFTMLQQGTPVQEVVDDLTAARAKGDAADNLMTTLSQAMGKEAEDRFKASEATYSRTVIFTMCALGLALILGGFLGVLIKRSIANPLVDVSQKAGLVAEGDLNQHFNTERSDEIGQLAGSLEKMVGNLRERIHFSEQKTQEAAEQSRKATEAMGEAQVAKDKAEAGQKAILQAAENVEAVVARLSAATEQLSAQIEQSSRSASVQRDRVVGSATAMEEMNATVLEVARNAGVASEGSENARRKAEEGFEIVKKSISALSVVQTDTHALRTDMEQLGKQAESIGNIMTVISDIADQTNLLALNAAIEAARAGEAGRGFAVVADEVRKLAEKTMTATKEVGSAISGIQQGTQKSIGAVQKTTQNLDAANNLATESGSALNAIVHESERTADQVRGIAAAAEEQSATSEEINRSLEEINRIADETAKVMSESAMAVTELANQSSQLQALVRDLRK